jgi:hypothetical protein
MKFIYVCRRRECGCSVGNLCIDSRRVTTKPHRKDPKNIFLKHQRKENSVFLGLHAHSLSNA